MNTEEQLERIIDRVGLSVVLSHLVTICYEKADHLRSNWQDERSAKEWERDAKTIDRISGKMRAS